MVIQGPKICLCMGVQIRKLTDWKKEFSLLFLAKIMKILDLIPVISKCKKQESQQLES